MWILKNENESFLEKIKDIKTIRYNYTYDHQNTNHIGFIAQDFVDIFPELLRIPSDGYYSLDYQKMTVVLLECVRELQDEIKKLKMK